MERDKRQLFAPNLVCVRVGEERYAWSVCFRPRSVELLTGIFLGSGIWFQLEGCRFCKRYFGRVQG